MICPNLKRRYFKQRISYYSNHVTCFSINKPLVNHPNPGQGRNGNKNHLVNCLYLNARSLVHKMDELQTLAIGVDLIAVTETWFKPTILDCELFPALNFTIHRRDRIWKAGGGVLLAVQNTIPSIRRRDLEGNAESVICELRPDSRSKLLVMTFYRPSNSNIDNLKELKKSLWLACQSGFDQLFGCGDSNLPNIDWGTGAATTSDATHKYFTKLVNDNFLWQLVNFPTRNNNTLDLILTNIPDKASTASNIF